MGKQDDAIKQKRAQDEFVQVQALANILGAQAINWRRVIDRYGNAFNTQQLSKIILIDTMGMMIPMDPLGMIPPQLPTGGTPPPRMVGRGPAGGGGAGGATMPGLMMNAGTNLGAAPVSAGGGAGPASSGRSSARRPGAGGGAQ
jgi:hypothetical protein